MPKSGVGRIYQRGGVWWIDYSCRGKRTRESTESARRSDAVKLLQKRMGEIARGQLVGPKAEKVTFADLAQGIRDDYKVNGRRSVKSLEGALKRLGRFFGMDKALDITTDRVKRYCVMRQEAGAANATIQGELAALKRAFNLAVQANILATRPHIPSVRVSNARQGFFDAADLERVLAELPAESAAITRFAALTGWRKGEVVPLTWSQVDFAAGIVRLSPGSTKNGDGRSFPFLALPPLEALIEEQRAYTQAMERELGQIIPWVFHRRGRPVTCFRTAWENACKRAGVPGMLFHDLRRTAVMNLERAAVPRSVAMKLTGHKTEAVYRRYAIADHAALSEGVEKLARLHAQPVQAKVLPIAR